MHLGMHLGMHIDPTLVKGLDLLTHETIPTMAAKKSVTTREPTTKRPSRKQAKKLAEDAAGKVLMARHVEPLPQVTPLELAHLVAAMGLGDRADGPAKALSLVSRSAAYIDAMKAQFERLNDVLGQDKAATARMMAELGLGLEAVDKTFSVDEVIAKMSTRLLKVGRKLLQGKALWEEFRRQVDPKPGRPGKADKDGTSPEEYLLSDLLRVYREFTEWRDKIATANLARGSKNLDKTNRDRRKRDLLEGAEAVDAIPLPKTLKRNTSEF